MKKSRLFLAAPVFAAAMFSAAPVFAAGYDGNGVTTSATEAVAGAEVLFQATGFKPNSAVTITLSKSGVSAMSVTSSSAAALTINTTADAAGSVSVSVKVSASENGMHHLMWRTVPFRGPSPCFMVHDKSV